MSPKRTYYGFTTPQQRKLLFETWQATGSVTQACQTARTSRGLFYYWKSRFEQSGYAGLEVFDSRVAHHLNSKAEPIQQRVLQMHQDHPEWGKTRIAQELARKPLGASGQSQHRPAHSPRCPLVARERRGKKRDP